MHSQTILKVSDRQTDGWTDERTLCLLWYRYSYDIFLQTREI